MKKFLIICTLIVSTAIFAHDAKNNSGKVDVSVSIKYNKLVDECTYTITIRDTDGTVRTSSATAATCVEAKKKAIDKLSSSTSLE